MKMHAVRTRQVLDIWWVSYKVMCNQW